VCLALVSGKRGEKTRDFVEEDGQELLPVLSPLLSRGFEQPD
jgi:hypothetical protein